MSFKDISVQILAVAQDETAIAAAQAIGQDHDANVTAILFEVQPDPVYTTEGAVVGVVWDRLLEEAQKEFAAEKKKLDERAKKGPRPFATLERQMPAVLLGSEAGVNARYADLTILTRPQDEGWQSDLRMAMFEGVLFGAGKPVLLAPPDWRAGAIGRNIVVAWNGKRESARALADAAPFLTRADKITVMTVGAGRHGKDFPRSAAEDAVAHLTRRGLRAQTRVIDDVGLGEGEALLAEAGALNADLLVMGGYGRSRLGELIFGGVTRHVIAHARLPIMMSH